ncbi:class I peptide chain release factor [Sporocytophaga myxococcoides]|uniref:Class I peptide chain release factor n=1 Tax=Sporocytophaga myxococcoides TaxID=153721 RepID=A0A098LJK3_9BACT|nr:alternative ribosome rescue aminoacyl-tRNA hydrolase ArfB [Sporocytophaga myxococcoides]GAL86602.1 class I peptide chain release factor [Sporocytophaga myxococcoides]
MITEKISQLLREVTFQASRSSGPGGQNVNKVNSKIELIFSVAHSSHFTEEEKHLLFKKLGHKINSEGELRVVAQTERTQTGNKRLAETKFIQIIENALKKPKKRINTKPTLSSVADRKNLKKKLSEKKSLRRTKFFD